MLGAKLRFSNPPPGISRPVDAGIMSAKLMDLI